MSTGSANTTVALNEHLRSNNALERTVSSRGPRLAAAQPSWPAAQLGR
jgi:hypothetical protein